MFNVLCSLSRVQPSHLHAPDLLHRLYLGLLEHLMEWIKGLLKRYKCQNYFDKAWKSVPSYYKLTKPNKPYQQVSQWQEKEIRSFGQIILAMLAASLSCTWSTVYLQTVKQ